MAAPGQLSDSASRELLTGLARDSNAAIRQAAEMAVRKLDAVEVRPLPAP